MMSAERELERIRAILSASEVAGQERLAIYLALAGTLDAAQAVEVIRANSGPAPEIIAAAREAEAITSWH